MTFPRKKRKESTTTMASASTSPTQTQREKESCEPKSSNSTKSCFQPTVCLKDWWLIRAESDSQGRTLAVAGLTSREGQALRVFSSAPIRKIYDVFNLETIDGICIVLKGFINKSRSEENGFPSEVFEQFLFGFPPQWETFNEKCLGGESKGKAAASDALGSEKSSVYSENVQDLKKIDQKDHVEATDEKIQDHNGREDYEVEDNLMRDNQNDGEVASEVIVQKKTKRATRSSNKLNRNEREDNEVEDNLMRDNQNDGKFASEVIVQKKTKRATRSLDKLNHNGREDYEVDNLMRDNQNDGEVASEVIVQKKTKRATRSSDKLNHNRREDYEVEENLIRDHQNDGEVASEVIVQKKTKRATRSSDKLNHNGIDDYEVEDNLRMEVASEVIVQKKTKRATRSSYKLNHNGREDYEVEDNLMRDNQNDGEVASEVVVQKKTKRATRSSGKLHSTNTSTSIAKEQTADVNRTTHFKSASASTKNAKRKLTYGSPQQGKETVPLISPEPSSFNRSRSGRVLLPPMAFWRNQRAVYNADQSVTEVKQGDPKLDNLSRGT